MYLKTTWTQSILRVVDPWDLIGRKYNTVGSILFDWPQIFALPWIDIDIWKQF